MATIVFSLTAISFPLLLDRDVDFITAMIVVKTFLTYVTRHGFTFFAWWRVIVGTLGLIALALGK